MEKIVKLIIILLFLNSCTQKRKKEIILFSENSTWVGYKGFHFEKELILCGIDSKAKLKLTEKLNEKDTILIGKNNTFTYSTHPNKVGLFEIKGKIIANGKETEFSHKIVILPKMESIGFNVKNALNLKIGVENEIIIETGYPKKYRTLETDNGKIIEKDNQTFIIPERIGKCRIKIKVNLPSNEQMEINDIVFNVKD